MDGSFCETWKTCFINVDGDLHVSLAVFSGPFALLSGSVTTYLSFVIVATTLLISRFQV